MTKIEPHNISPAKKCPVCVAVNGTSILTLVLLPEERFTCFVRSLLQSGFIQSEGNVG
jgi:hypothetical protein